MKTDKSSNTHDTNRKVFHPENHEALKEKDKLQGRGSGDGREGSYEIKDEIGDEEQGKDMKGLTKESEANKEDVKKEFEIRSGKSEDKMGEKRGKDPAGESDEEGIEKNEEVGAEKGSGSWRKSYKGDAELVP